MPKRLRANAFIINRGAYRLECDQHGRWTHIFHLLTDFELKCVELFERIQCEGERIYVHIQGGGDPIEFCGIPSEAISLLEWMIACNRDEKNQHLDSGTLESTSDTAYTYNGNGKQTSQYLFKGNQNAIAHN